MPRGFVRELHVHNCGLDGCEALVECDGFCVEGDVPKIAFCPAHIELAREFERNLWPFSRVSRIVITEPAEE